MVSVTSFMTNIADHSPGFFLSHISCVAQSLVFPPHCSVGVRLPGRHIRKQTTLDLAASHLSRHLAHILVCGSQARSPVPSPPRALLLAAGEHADGGDCQRVCVNTSVFLRHELAL